MADHVQQQILEAIQAVLVAAAIVPGGRVYLDRTDELPEDDLPAIDILGRSETFDESIEYLSLDFPYLQQREMAFPIACIARSATTAAAISRNLGKQVEQAILAAMATVSIGGKRITMRINAVRGAKSNDQATPMAAVIQSWTAQYHTQAGAPDAAF